MTWVTKLYRWMKNLKTPKWLVSFLDILAKDVIYPVLQKLGEEAVEFLRYEIETQIGMSISGSDKLKNVVRNFKANYANISISDQALNMAIEIILGMIKKKLS